jgi:hypothetical protein
MSGLVAHKLSGFEVPKEAPKINEINGVRLN